MIHNVKGVFTGAESFHLEVIYYSSLQEHKIMSRTHNKTGSNPDLILVVNSTALVSGAGESQYGSSSEDHECMSKMSKNPIVLHFQHRNGGKDKPEFRDDT